MTDVKLQNDVLDVLKNDPKLHETCVGVEASGGVITLLGSVDTTDRKQQIEEIVSHIEGVRAIAVELRVREREKPQLGDAFLAQAAVAALESAFDVPRSEIVAKVEGGVLTLEGDVDRLEQRDAADRAVKAAPGIRDIVNLISLRAAIDPQDIVERIEKSLERSAVTDAAKIRVHLDGRVVTLSGDVSSWIEHDEAESAAAAIPGVVSVNNELNVVLGSYDRSTERRRSSVETRR
jgi:osmotically-inducible protein OsmY